MSGYLLKEDGGYVLKEDGGKILLFAAAVGPSFRLRSEIAGSVQLHAAIASEVTTANVVAHDIRIVSKVRQP